MRKSRPLDSACCDYAHHPVWSTIACSNQIYTYIFYTENHPYSRHRIAASVWMCRPCTAPMLQIINPHAPDRQSVRWPYNMIPATCEACPVQKMCLWHYQKLTSSFFFFSSKLNARMTWTWWPIFLCCCFDFAAVSVVRSLDIIDFCKVWKSKWQVWERPNKDLRA